MSHCLKHKGDYTDEFWIHKFKVVPCTKTYSHSWSSCPCAHPGETARRRDPNLYPYQPVLCPNIKLKTGCPAGDDCEFAHNVFEQWLHPQRYKALMCTYGSQCTRPSCFFAHSLEELRAPWKGNLPAGAGGTSGAGSQPARTSSGGNGISSAHNSGSHAIAGLHTTIANGAIDNTADSGTLSGSHALEATSSSAKGNIVDVRSLSERRSLSDSNSEESDMAAPVSAPAGAHTAPGGLLRGGRQMMMERVGSEEQVSGEFAMHPSSGNTSAPRSSGGRLQGRARTISATGDATAGPQAMTQQHHHHHHQHQGPHSINGTMAGQQRGGLPMQAAHHGPQMQMQSQGGLGQQQQMAQAQSAHMGGMPMQMLQQQAPHAMLVQPLSRLALHNQSAGMMQGQGLQAVASAPNQARQMGMGGHIIMHGDYGVSSLDDTVVQPAGSAPGSGWIAVQGNPAGPHSPANGARPPPGAPMGGSGPSTQSAPSVLLGMRGLPPGSLRILGGMMDSAAAAAATGQAGGGSGMSGISLGDFGVSQSASGSLAMLGSMQQQQQHGGPGGPPGSGAGSGAGGHMGQMDEEVQSLLLQSLQLQLASANIARNPLVTAFPAREWLHAVLRGRSEAVTSAYLLDLLSKYMPPDQFEVVRRLMSSLEEAAQLLSFFAVQGGTSM